MNRLTIALLAALFGTGSVLGIAITQATHPQTGVAPSLASAATALADPDDRDPCGHWDNGRWVSDRDDRGYCRRHDGDDNGSAYNNGNGNGYGYGRDRSSSVSGRIVGIDGNHVLLRRGRYDSVTIDDQPALDRRSTGRVYLGRDVTAYGYWRNNVFYATSIQ